MTETKKPIGELTQRYGLWKEQELTLFEDELKIRYRSGPNLSKRTVPLEMFDTNESEGRVFPETPRRGFSAAVSVAVAFFAVAVAVRVETGAAPAWMLWTGGAAAALAAVFAVAYLALAYDASYFYHAYTGDFLCAVVDGKPDAPSAAEFLKRLKAQIKLRSERARSEMERLSVARELKALHELREKKVISDEEFATKKEDLIAEIMRE